MAKQKILLCKQQKEIMRLFYAVAPTKIVLLKKEYDDLWKEIKAKKNLTVEKEKELNSICPAIVCEIQKSIINQSSMTAGYSRRYLVNVFMLKHWQTSLIYPFFRIMQQIVHSMKTCYLY
jgi:hypothetical protein